MKHGLSVHCRVAAVVAGKAYNLLIAVASAAVVVGLLAGAVPAMLGPCRFAFPTEGLVSCTEPDWWGAVWHWSVIGIFGIMAMLQVAWLVLWWRKEADRQSELFERGGE